VEDEQDVLILNNFLLKFKEKNFDDFNDYLKNFDSLH
jgi:hypothetical protein